VAYSFYLSPGEKILTLGLTEGPVKVGGKWSLSEPLWNLWGARLYDVLQALPLTSVA
jgi:hypothetical protein